MGSPYVLADFNLEVVKADRHMTRFKFSGYSIPQLSCIVVHNYIMYPCTYIIIHCTDTDDEDFCDNINRTLPNSLVQDLVAPSVNPFPDIIFGGGALSVVSLLQPALLLVSLLLATLLLH